MSKKFIAYIKKSQDVARAPSIIDPAWDGIENYMDGVFYEGEIPQPENQEGYTFIRWVNLKDPENPQIYYTYEPLPEPEETKIDRLSRELEEAKKEIVLSNAQLQAASDRADFQEDLIQELALMIYQ